MKRWGDSQAFIPLIIVIFVLLAGMAMTGRATAGMALTEAAYNGQADLVKDLLDKGADVNERGACGSNKNVTSLWCAAYAGQMEAVKVLLARGADMNARSETGWPPLATAVSERHGNIARLLVARGADTQSSIEILKKNGRVKGYRFIEGLVNLHQQQSRNRVSPPTFAAETESKPAPRADAPASRPVGSVVAAVPQAPVPPTVTTDVKPKAEPRPEAPAAKPVEAVKTAQAQTAVPPAVRTDPGPKAVPSTEAPASRLNDAVAAAQAQAAAQPMNWRALNALGIALYQARRYISAAGAFEQAIAVFPIATVAETEQKAKEARERAFEAQQTATKEAQVRQKKAQEEMQNQQILSGLLGIIPNMPGATANTHLMAQMGQTMLNVGMTPSASEPLLPGLPMEEVPSQVMRTRELAALHTNLGLTRMALREDDTAIEAFRQAYTMDASRVDLLFMQAHLLQRSDVGSALPLYVRYLEVALEARQPGTWVEIAAVYRRLGLESERSNALAAARKAWDHLVGQSANARTERAFGRILSKAGFYREALNPLQTWVRAFPEDAAGQREWAIALFGAGRMEEARDAMKSSISTTKSAPSDGGFATYFMGMTELHLGRVDEAKRILGALYPPAEAKTTSGFVAAAHALCGHVDEEKEWISRVENGRSDPDAAVADWYRLGWVWFVVGNRPRAAECVSRCLELQPEFGPALRLQEQLLNGSAERVKSARSEAAASRGNITFAVQRLSTELSDMPMGAKWMALAREGMGYVAKLQAPPRMPREAQKYFLRAQAILKNASRPAEIREALGEYRWALRYAPLAPDIHLHLSSVYATQKQYSQALRHIETCLAGFQPSEKLDAIIGRYYELQYLEERTQRNIRAIRPSAGAQ